MTLCYLGLGSNLHSPQRQLRQAIASLHKLPSTTIISVSSLYISKPCGVRWQPNYYNLVLAIHTSLPPTRLLHYCQAIENKQQRLRKKRWAARTLDIDLLLYGKIIINSHELIVPHPQMLLRDFVLVPLLQISPTAKLPNGTTIFSYTKQCKNNLIREA